MSEWTQTEVLDYVKTGIEPRRSRLRDSLRNATWAVPERLEITIPLPPKATHPNARPNWKAKASATKKQRASAAIASAAILLNGEWLPPRWESAEVEATFYLPRSHDSSNLSGWLKATWDGLQDAQIILNDSGLTVLPPKQITGAAAKKERKVVLVISVTPTRRAAV